MMSLGTSVASPSQESAAAPAPASAPTAASSASVSVASCPETIRRSVLEIIQHETQAPFDPEQLPGSFGRVPIEVSFRLLPVSFDGTSILLDKDQCVSEVALTRDLSCEGVAFEHPASLDERYALAFFPALETKELALLFERLWSRQLGPLEFLSGGRFVGIVSLNVGSRPTISN